jgi:glycosidase
MKPLFIIVGLLIGRGNAADTVSPSLHLPAAALAPAAPLNAGLISAPTALAPQIAPLSTPAAAPQASPVPESREASALKGAWRAARYLVEAVPGAPDSIADAPLTLDPNRVYEPSPEDWRDHNVYYIQLDRFARSGPGRPVGPGHDGNTRHGGNLRGVIERLDYLKGLGATLLMLSPVTQTFPDASHGYAPLHMMAIDPHLGTMADLQELTAEAAKRGMIIGVDWIINHAGPVFEYKDGSKYTSMTSPPKEIRWTHSLKPVELADERNFTRRGVINNWDDREQAVNGDFPPNYRHYDSERPATAELLIHIANWFVKESGVGFMRVDAARHIPIAFLHQFKQRVRDYAAMLGKKNFMFAHEISTGRDEDLAPFLGNAKADSAFSYPAFRRDNQALHGAASSKTLSDSHVESVAALGDKVGMLMRFLDNQDTYRFLRVGEPLEVLHTALAYVMLSIGVPAIYYGTEQAFRQGTDRLEPENGMFPADPFNREDMFAGGLFKSASSAGDKFDATSPTYRFVAKLNALRARFPALRRGSQWIAKGQDGRPGIYAFRRIYGNEEVVVAINFANSREIFSSWVDADLTPPHVILHDALDPSYQVETYGLDGGTQINVEVPPHGVRVLVRKLEAP